MQRLRVRFTRGEEIKYLSHLDMTRLWERVFTRAGVDIAFSEGFNPHPRLSLAAPLVVGMTAESELMDIFVEGTITPHWFMSAVKNQLPVGVDILDTCLVSTLLPSLQAQVKQADYCVKVGKVGGPDDVEKAIEAILDSDTFPWSHERDTGKREYDLRPLIDDIRLVSDDGAVCTLEMRLRCDSTGSGRPEQVVKALGFTAYPFSISRTRLLLGS